MSGIKDVLVVNDLAGPRRSTSVAADLAVAFGAHLTGISPVYETIVPTYAIAPVPGEFIEAARTAALEEASAGRAAFEEVARRAGVAFASRTIDILGGGFTRILRACRLSDLVVIGQDDPDNPEPMRTALMETILLESGVPVVVVPYVKTEGFKFGRALVGWDGSAPAAAAVHAALPLLAMTKNVEVLIVEASRTADESGYDVADYLARHDLKVTVTRVPAGDLAVADILLNHVADNSVDYVVMGAYGHSRLREYVFGGATRDVLSEMTVPVVMAR